MARHRNRRRHHFAVFKHAIGFLPWVHSQKGGAESQYDQLCTAIEKWSQTAGALYNRGRAQEAYTALDKARQSFGAASKLHPSDPQAYVSFATSMLNAQKFDESVYLWRKARNLVANGAWNKDKGILGWLKGRIRYTKYGKVSVARDLLYAQGQGNMTAAVELMNKQLAIYPSAPVLRHDRATAQVMLSELWGSNTTVAAVADFHAAQKLAHSAWRAGIFQRKRGGDLYTSEASKELVYDWPAWFSRGRPASGALVALDPATLATDLGTYGPNGSFHDHGAYVAQFQDVGLAGQDGIIVDEARCQIFVASSGPSVNLAWNLQMLETWGDRPAPQDGPRFGWFDFNRGALPNHGQIKDPKRIAKAASLVQFAEASHFHSLTEVLARFWLLHSHGVFQDPEVVLIARPDGRKDGGFLSPVLHMLVPDLLKENRISWWSKAGGGSIEPDVRLHVGRLFYADWRPPAVFGEDGGHCSTPRSVLLPAHRMLRDALAVPPSPVNAEARTHGVAARAIIFVLRRNQDMRSRLEREEELQRELRGIADAADPALSFEDFDGSPSAAATVALFSRARAVVGVHGGALTNIIFCSAGAELFEMGFATPFAGHYRHLAAAVGLRATLLPLAADHRGIGAKDVGLADFDAAVATLRVALVGSSKIPVTSSVEERVSMGEL